MAPVGRRVISSRIVAEPRWHVLVDDAQRNLLGSHDRCVDLCSDVDVGESPDTGLIGDGHETGRKYSDVGEEGMMNPHTQE